MQISLRSLPAKWMKVLSSIRRSFVILALLILFLSVTSCVETGGNGVTNSPSLQMAPKHPLPEETMPPPTNLPTSIISPTRLCEHDQSDMRDTSGIGGSLIYRDPETNKTLVFDISSKKKKIVEEITGIFAHVSHDGGRIADYDKENLDKLRILTPGQELTLTPPKSTYLEGFLDDGRILLGVPDVRDQNVTSAGTTDELYLISTDYEKIVAVSNFLPDYYESSRDVPTFTQYSPNFKYVIYPIRTHGETKNAILNLDTGKVIWTGWQKGIPDIKGIVPGPIWRPDSRAVTIVDQDQLNQRFNFFNVSPYGQMTQLTRLEYSVEGEYLLLRPTWSPDSRYLAFPIWLDKRRTESLFVLDTRNRKIIDSCVTWDLPYPDFTITWSPDSKFIALNPEYGTKIKLIDVENEQVYELETNEESRPSLLWWLDWENP